MIKNIEITGTLKMESQKNIVVDLFSNGGKIDWFNLDCDEKSINTEISDTVGTILGVDINDYSDYMKLIADLGLEIPKWKKHWAPAEEWSYYSIDQGGNVEGLGSYGELSSARFRKENYNAFPTRELAEKAVNLSKLGRLILLWQYANNCLYTPNWNNRQLKWFISYDTEDDLFIYDTSNFYLRDISYFETEEQAKAFVNMYNKELIRLMSVK